MDDNQPRIRGHHEPEIPPEPDLRRDFIWLAIVSVLVAAVAAQLDLVTLLYGRLDDMGITWLLAVFAVFAVGAAMFALRRYREAWGIRAELSRLSMHDALTGLPNRRYLSEHFGEMVRKTRRSGGRVTVFFLDLDRFKGVNDTYGHEVGDDLMMAASDRITGVLSADDIVIRYGGDEFVAVCPNTSNSNSAERIARRLIDVIEEPFEVNEDRIQISVSIGIAIAEERVTEPDDIIRDADAAMYKAKAAGVGSFAIYDRSMEDRVTPTTAEKRLRQALEDGEFTLHYQPVVSLQTQRMVKVESLIRWQDPDRGLVSPGEFIPALEDTGLIVPVGAWILEEACRQAHEWHQRYVDQAPLSVTINVSARQVNQADFCDVLGDVLSRTGVDPGNICLEITEGALMNDVDQAWTMLREAKNLGVYLALDDFGTGFSSLSFLRQFSLDIVKIDKSFVDGLGTSREDTTIVEHVVGMARGLGMVTVAEGVETADQVRYLRSLECHMAQGFFYSKPQPPAVIDRIMTQPVTQDRVEAVAANAPAPPVVQAKHRNPVVPPLARQA